MKRKNENKKRGFVKKFGVGAMLTATLFCGGTLLSGCMADGKDGANGENGKSGATWYSGTATPTIATNPGSVGDFYFDEDDNLIYKLTETGWVLVADISGAPGQDGQPGQPGQPGQDGEPGKDGASFLSGVTDPTVELGKNGDTYLNYITYDLFTKSYGVWSWVANIKSEQTQTPTINKTTINKQGGLNNPVLITEDDITDVVLTYKDNQALTLYGPNRLNYQTADFKTNSWSSYNIISREENGFKIDAKELSEVSNANTISYDYIAEFTGKLWLTCDASCTGDVTDLGMRMSLNGTAQQLCRGTGKLQEAVDVTAGDTVRLTFYTHIGTSAANVLSYKNIMLNYGDNPIDYTDYFADASTKITTATRSIDLTTLTFDDLTTTGTIAGNAGYYGFKFELNEKLPAEYYPSDNESFANVTIEGLPLISYNAAYRNEIGIGIGSGGTAFAYLGEGFTRTTAAEWFKNNPVTISYVTDNEEVSYVKLDASKVQKGCMLVSDEDFTVSYTFTTPKEKSKSIVCFGDSITGMATNGSDYVSMIERSSDFNAYNVGFSGASWTDYPSGGRYLPFSMCRLVDSVCGGDFSTQEASVAGGNVPEVYAERLETLKSVDFNTVDYITIFYGTNDWGNGSTLKSADDTNTTNKQYSNMEDAINYTITKLNKNFPQAKIIVLTPYWRILNKEDCLVTPNKSGDYLYDYSKYMEEVAKKNDVLRVVNMFDLLPINYDNYKSYIPDGTHPNESLKNIIANIIIRNIERFS